MQLRYIFKNSLFNLLGSFLPLVFALIFVPFIIEKIGTDRFGILTIAWVIIGYFGFFDLGLGRALTRIISEKIGLNSTKDNSNYFWTVFFLTFIFSIIISFCLFLFSDKIIKYFLKIPTELHDESLKAFYFLFIAIPFVSTSTGFRGYLEAYQRFDIVNIIRIFLGISTFLIPALVSFIKVDLSMVIFFLLIIRIISWFAYLFAINLIDKNILSLISFNRNLIVPIFRLSGWMTISNIIIPLIIYLDRLMIASIVSSRAVAYYATPYELVTKLLIIPSALTSVLFPTFAANYLTKPIETIKLAEKAIKYIFTILFPIVLCILFFAFDFLNLWINKEFAKNSYFILQFLAIGILFNSVAYIPFSFIEGIGRPDITAKIQLMELPIYMFLIFVSIKNFGIKGVSVVFSLRILVDCFLMLYLSGKIVGKKNEPGIVYKFVTVFLILMIISQLVIQLTVWLRVLIYVISLNVFLLLTWKYILDESDKNFIIEKITMSLTKK